MPERLEPPAGDRGDLRCRKSSFTGSFAWTVVTEPDSRWMGKQSTVSSKKGRPMIIRACTGSWTCGVSGRSCRKGTGPTEDEFKYGVETLAITACAAETVHVHISENDRGTPGS